MLQETHSTSNIEKFWRSQWGGEIFFAHGDSNARGVVTLVNKSVNCNLISHVADKEGRKQIIKLPLERKELVLFNIYAPNKDSPEFFEIISREYASIETDNVILAGDFNLALEKIDRSDDRMHANHLSQKIIKSWYNDFAIRDVWRTHHPDKREYTWKRSAKAFIKVRLDYIFAANNVMQSIPASGINNGHISDHRIPYIIYQENDNVRGPGFWRFNTSLLQDEDYCEQIRELVNTKKQESFPTVTEKWDWIKSEIRGFTVKYTTRKKKSKINQLAVIDKKITFFENEKIEVDSEELVDQINRRITELEVERKNLLDSEVRGLMIRSRRLWLEEGEKSSKYFFNLEKSNYKKKNRYQLYRESVDGIELVTKQKEILDIQDSYYQNLFKSTRKKIGKKYLNSVTLPGLDDMDRDSLARDISKNEIRDALWSMKLNKTPGNEGLPVEFYKHFWGEIQGLVYFTIQEALEKGEMSIGSKRGVITLIEKEAKDPLYIKNWRPLSLLNLDNKILSKVLALRLEKVLPQLIHTDQTGFMKNRSIQDNIFDLLNAIEWAKMNNQDSNLISFDFEKVFDRVERNILFQIMRKKFRFPERFIDYVKVLYKGAVSCTLNCGYTGKYFDIERSLRQGCALSAPIFLLLVEFLGQKIRENKKLKVSIFGIPIKN